MALFLLRVHLKPHLKLFMSTLPSSPGFWARLRLLTSQASREARKALGWARAWLPGPGFRPSGPGLQFEILTVRYIHPLGQGAV